MAPAMTAKGAMTVMRLPKMHKSALKMYRDFTGASGGIRALDKKSSFGYSYRLYNIYLVRFRTFLFILSSICPDNLASIYTAQFWAICTLYAHDQNSLFCLAAAHNTLFGPYPAQEHAEQSAKQICAGSVATSPRRCDIMVCGQIAIEKDGTWQTR